MRFQSRSFILPVLLGIILFPGKSPTASGASRPTQPQLHGAYRFKRANWIYVHLQGTPHQIGFENGYLLAPEIEDGFHAIRLEDTHSTHRSWKFYRATAKNVYWPHIEAQYREELQGIADGAKAHGITDIDLWDVVAINGFNETDEYYVPYLEKQKHQTVDASLQPRGRCSAFVATGDWTRDHKPVIAHSLWSTFLEGERWRILYDIVPQHGYRILMDGWPGKIDSGDDFGINSAGISITETTITGFHGFDPNAVPEFVRARKAMQYAASIDDFERIMVTGNNGGYANDWLIADNRTGEVARLELGLKIHRLWRTKNGYFVGSNFPSDPTLTKEETTFDPNDAGNTANARHKRWDQLMAQYKGKIDATLAQKFLADHFDAYTGKWGPDERTLCGHVDVSPRGVPEWGDPPFDPEGATNAKAADSSMVSKMSFVARIGRPCGQDFLAAPFLAKHPQFAWQKPALKDMKGNPWALFRANDHVSSSAVTTASKN
ncbi:MAG: C45 family autoproteolytic acyltransferase/hydolase [Acidobacteriaceae bacterium]